MERRENIKINMSVKIRLKRVGAKNHPVFRIVVADSRSPRDGKFIEELGTYHPQKKGDKFTLNLERAQYWLSQGAQPSETMASFIKKAAKAADGQPEEKTAPAAATPQPVAAEKTPEPAPDAAPATDAESAETPAAS